MWVTLSRGWHAGAAVRQAAERTFAAQRLNAATAVVSANTRDDLYLFSAKGQATRVAIHQIPEAPGSHLADLSGFTRRDRIVALSALPKTAGEEPASSFLLLATTQGKVKRIALADLVDQAGTDPQVIGLDDGDELVWAGDRLRGRRVPAGHGAGAGDPLPGGGCPVRWACPRAASAGSSWRPRIASSRRCGSTRATRRLPRRHRPTLP